MEESEEKAHRPEPIAPGSADGPGAVLERKENGSSKTGELRLLKTDPKTKIRRGFIFTVAAIVTIIVGGIAIYDRFLKPRYQPSPQPTGKIDSSQIQTQQPVKKDKPPSKAPKQLSPSIAKETDKQVAKPEEPKKVEEPKPLVYKGKIKVSCHVIPYLINPNETAVIKVFTNSPSRTESASNADIFITSTGGIFPSTGTSTLVGKTDWLGCFETLWNPPKDVKGFIRLGVEVKKEGFGTGVGICTGYMQSSY